MASVWITGGRGFIGRHLAKHFAEGGHFVSGLGHGAWPARDAALWGMAHWVNGDIQPGNLRQLMLERGAPDFVYHLAGGSSVGAAIASPREDFARTVSTTAELLDWVRLETPTTRVIAVSSAAVYGAGHSGGITEDKASVPFSPYGYHKLMMEQLCRSYAATYGTRVAVARLFSVYGTYLQKQLLWDLCSRLSAGVSTVELGGTGGELRDWTDVRDVVRALDLVKDLASDASPVVNVGTGIATDVRRVSSLVAQAWPVNVEIVFNGKSRTGDPFSLVADGSHLQSLGFGWRITPEAGVRDYVQWYLRQTGSGV
jgi:UDP-glucose 4-epimerase